MFAVVPYNVTISRGYDVEHAIALFSITESVSAALVVDGGSMLMVISVESRYEKKYLKEFIQGETKI